MIGALSEEVYAIKDHWLTRLAEEGSKVGNQSKVVETSDEQRNADGILRAGKDYRLEIILAAKSYKEAIAEVSSLNAKKVVGERTILPTTAIIEYLGFQVPVYWSLCGECFTGTVMNGDLSQSFWSRDWEDFQRLLPEAVMQVIIPEECLSQSDDGAGVTDEI